MKIIAISDTHTLHKKQTPPKGDVIVHAGDFSGHGNYNEFIDFIRWFGALPHPHKIFIAGNHDRWLEGGSREEIQRIVNHYVGDNTHYLYDSSVVIDGKKFYGAPWQPEFCNWSFQAPRGARMAEKWDMIPDDTNVLITHGPAYGHGDYVPMGKRHAGCLELLIRIKEIGPQLHICGHIHEGYGVSRSDECPDTKFINAAMMRGGFDAPYNKAQISEIY